jgi:hypothetical protein
MCRLTGAKVRQHAEYLNARRVTWRKTEGELPNGMKGNDLRAAVNWQLYPN